MGRKTCNEALNARTVGLVTSRQDVIQMSSSDAEDLQVEQIKSFVIGVISAALGARTLEDTERLERYRHDYLLLIEDLTVQDIFMSMSLMGDVTAALVATIASSYDVTPEAAMLHLASEIKGTKATGGGF